MAEVNLAEIKFGGAVGDRQTDKLNSPTNFPAMRYNGYIVVIKGAPSLLTGVSTWPLSC